MKGPVTFNSISEDNTGYKLCFLAGKQNALGPGLQTSQHKEEKMGQLEHQLLWGSPEPLMLTREPARGGGRPEQLRSHCQPHPVPRQPSAPAPPWWALTPKFCAVFLH